MSMRFLDRRAELGARDVHVRLERVHALVGPEGDLLAGIVRRGDHMVLDKEGARSFEVRPSHVEVRPDEVTRIDLPLQRKVGVGLDASGLAHLLHPVG